LQQVLIKPKGGRAVVRRGHEANKQQAAAEARAAREPKPPTPPKVEAPLPPPKDEQAEKLHGIYGRSFADHNMGDGSK
jgi:hypothetical protein